MSPKHDPKTRPRPNETWTFQPDADVRRYVEAEVADLGGQRGAKTEVLNRLLRSGLVALISRRVERRERGEENTSPSKPRGARKG